MDPQINQLFKTQFMKFAEELKTNKKYSQLHNLDKYYEFIFSQCYKLKWVELEYCIKYPLVLFQHYAHHRISRAQRRALPLP